MAGSHWPADTSETADCRVVADLALGLVEDDVHRLQPDHGGVHAQRLVLYELVRDLRLIYARPCGYSHNVICTICTVRALRASRACHACAVHASAVEGPVAAHGRRRREGAPTKSRRSVKGTRPPGKSMLLAAFTWGLLVLVSELEASLADVSDLLLMIDSVLGLAGPSMHRQVRAKVQMLCL